MVTRDERRRLPDKTHDSQVSTRRGDDPIDRRAGQEITSDLICVSSVRPVTRHEIPGRRGILVPQSSKSHRTPGVTPRPHLLSSWTLKSRIGFSSNQTVRGMITSASHTRASDEKSLTSASGRRVFFSCMRTCETANPCLRRLLDSG